MPSTKKVLLAGFKLLRGADARIQSFSASYSYCFYSNDSRRLHLLLTWCRKLPHRPKPPRRGAFLLVVLGGYMLATRYKTPYRWLHGGYMSPPRKNPTIKLIAGFSMPVRAELVAWDGIEPPTQGFSILCSTD